MMLKHGLQLALLVALVGDASAATEPPRTRKEASDAWSEDGLQKMKIRGLDVAYARPETSLAAYDKVLLRPVTVAFRRDWGRSSFDTPGRVRPEDAQKIKDRLALLVTQELASEFKAGGYEVAQQPGDDVLELDIRITDLYIVAPDVPSAGRTDVYAVSAGEMTLIAELRDSSSGETIMRIYDRESGDSSSRMRRLTQVENAAEARRLAQDWAKALRKLLDAARVQPAP